MATVREASGARSWRVKKKCVPLTPTNAFSPPGATEKKNHKQPVRLDWRQRECRSKVRKPRTVRTGYIRRCSTLLLQKPGVKSLGDSREEDAYSPQRPQGGTPPRWSPPSATPSNHVRPGPLGTSVTRETLSLATPPSQKQIDIGVAGGSTSHADRHARRRGD